MASSARDAPLSPVPAVDAAHVRASLDNQTGQVTATSSSPLISSRSLFLPFLSFSVTIIN